MQLTTILVAAFAGLAAATPVQTSASQVSVTVGASTPLVTENRMVARAALPTCNPYNVDKVKSQQTHSSIFCSSWRSASVHSAPLTVTGLENWQISNICSCILTGTYVSSPPRSTTTTTSAAVAKATTYQQIVIAHHNVHRANHSAPALTWSQSLANTAAQIGASCVYAHNTTANGGGYGQNIAAGVPSSNISAVITDLFYNNEVTHFPKPYGQQNPSMSDFENWGHFSQVVWKSTTQVGCATVDCSAKGLANVGQYVAPYFTVCNYGPPGNYLGEFGTGVGASLNQASVQWNYAL